MAAKDGASEQALQEWQLVSQFGDKISDVGDKISHRSDAIDTKMLTTNLVSKLMELDLKDELQTESQNKIYLLMKIKKVWYLINRVRGIEDKVAIMTLRENSVDKTEPNKLSYFRNEYTYGNWFAGLDDETKYDDTNPIVSFSKGNYSFTSPTLSSAERERHVPYQRSPSGVLFQTLFVCSKEEAINYLASLAREDKALKSFKLDAFWSSFKYEDYRDKKSTDQTAETKYLTLNSGVGVSELVTDKEISKRPQILKGFYPYSHSHSGDLYPYYKKIENNTEWSWDNKTFFSVFYSIYDEYYGRKRVPRSFKLIIVNTQEKVSDKVFASLGFKDKESYYDNKEDYHEVKKKYPVHQIYAIIKSENLESVKGFMKDQSTSASLVSNYLLPRKLQFKEMIDVPAEFVLRLIEAEGQKVKVGTSTGRSEFKDTLWSLADDGYLILHGNA